MVNKFQLYKNLVNQKFKFLFEIFMIKKENLDKTSAWPFVEAKKMLRERKT